MLNLTFLTKSHSSHVKSEVFSMSHSSQAEADIFYHNTFCSWCLLHF
jgi:hypothetical protein